MTPVQLIRSTLLNVLARSDLTREHIARELEQMGELEWEALADSCESSLPTLAERAELVRSFRDEP